MPVLATSAYITAETVMNRIRSILNDSEIPGGDVFTDDSVFGFDLLNSAFERVQAELAIRGLEVQSTEWWLIGIPSVPITDPECRVIIDDTGCNILYPNGIGNIYSLTPQLPPDLVIPIRLFERQNGTSSYTGPPMKQPNDGILSMVQQTFLVDWEWTAEGL